MPVLLRGVPTQYEPKLKNRFVLSFPNELDIPEWLVQTSGRPAIDIEATEIPYINTKSYVASKYSWGTIDIEFIDAIGPSTSQKLMEWVRLHAESYTGRMGYANSYKKQILIQALDPTGVIIETWKLFECQITKAEFDSNDHGSGDLLKPKITIQPYYCILEY